eukprot:TRINITY_DN405_c0_g1_i1.p1 TRINITY_DN405_c0_g1~~TRINITY_DN405_c0_g1_i1.p1  ORF type:complete len:266 (+),score=41.44 TRINITY_DN405_c0_g1_i1:141-938(+)
MCIRDRYQRRVRGKPNWMGMISKALVLVAACVLLASFSHGAEVNRCSIAARKAHCPPSAVFWGYGGCACALVFACLGAAYGTAKSGVGVANMGVMHPDMVMKSIIPVVMAGVLGIYGLIVAVLLASGSESQSPCFQRAPRVYLLPPCLAAAQHCRYSVCAVKSDQPWGYSSYSGFSALSAGMCCGLAGLSAGLAIGIVGDAGVRANARQPKLFVGVILILIFAEALGLYGLIVALILQSNKLECDTISPAFFLGELVATTEDCLG